MPTPTPSRPTARSTATAVAAAALLVAAGGTSAGAAPAPGHTSSRHHSCGAQTIDRTAPVVSSGNVLVDAPVSTVFALQADVAAWPSWRDDVVFVQRLDAGPLAPGSQFRWETGGITVTSTVAVVHRDRCLLWGGPASGIDGVHLWTFTPARGGTLVHTEESWSGAPVEQDVAGAQAALDASLATWRADLARTAEARAAGSTVGERGR